MQNATTKNSINIILDLFAPPEKYSLNGTTSYKTFLKTFLLCETLKSSSITNTERESKFSRMQIKRLFM